MENGHASGMNVEGLDKWRWVALLGIRFFVTTWALLSLKSETCQNKQDLWMTPCCLSKNGLAMLTVEWRTKDRLHGDHTGMNIEGVSLVAWGGHIWEFVCSLPLWCR